jgi:MYXO-CTERM domain-containing protein
MSRLFVVGVFAILVSTIACSSTAEPTARAGAGCAVVESGAKGVFTPLLAFAAALILRRRRGGDGPDA